MQKMENKLMTIFLNPDDGKQPAEHLSAEFAEGWLIKSSSGVSAGGDNHGCWLLIALERPLSSNADVLA